MKPAANFLWNQCRPQFLIGVAALFAVAASGCQKRSFNQASTESATSASDAKTYSCNPRAPIIPANAPSPTGVADFKQFKMTVDNSTSPYSVKIEKQGSFKEWLAVTAGKMDITKLAVSVTTGSLKSVVLSTFQVGYRYVVTVDTGIYGDATFAIFAGRSVKSDKFLMGSIMVEEKDYGIATGYSSLGGTLGECAPGSLKDDGVQGLLNAVAIDKTGNGVLSGGTSSSGGSGGTGGSATSNDKSCTIAGWISRSESSCAGKTGSCGATVTISGSGGTTNIRDAESTTSTLVKTIQNGTEVDVKGQNANGGRLQIEAHLTGSACL